MSENHEYDFLSSLIREEIDKYDRKIDTSDVGRVVSIGDGIANVFGLDGCVVGELIRFPGNTFGMAMNLEERSVSCILFGESDGITEGDVCHRTEKVVSVPVGDALLGRVIDALGRPIDGLGEIEASETSPVEREAPPIMDRQPVDEPLETGIKAIDSMIPIGKGQRELIIGDRQTGKTALAVDAIIHQKGKDVLCVYCAIGQKNSSLAQIVSKLKEFDALSYTCIVNASASESASMLYLAPFAATSIAERWMRDGKDVLVIYDDLSKHAVAYRALSLLLRRSPGREAYPGDIFYLHARLLERSCRLKKELGGGSITALPIVETQAGDISAYIPTNVISITDGQIFLNADLFNEGQRPAIDSGLSVSRVGSSAQCPAMKEVSASLRMELASYREMLDFARFGSDLDKATLRILSHGASLMQVLRQKQYKPLSMPQEVVDVFLAQEGLLDSIPPEQIHDNLKAMDNVIRAQAPEIYENLERTKAVDAKAKEALRSLFLKVRESLQKSDAEERGG